MQLRSSSLSDSAEFLGYRSDVLPFTTADTIWSRSRSFKAHHDPASSRIRLRPPFWTRGSSGLRVRRPLCDRYGRDPRHTHQGLGPDRLRDLEKGLRSFHVDPLDRAGKGPPRLGAG